MIRARPVWPDRVCVADAARLRRQHADHLLVGRVEPGGEPGGLDYRVVLGREGGRDERRRNAGDLWLLAQARRCGAPCIQVLQHAGVEAVDRVDHGVDEGAPSLPRFVPSGDMRVTLNALHVLASGGWRVAVRGQQPERARVSGALVDVT